MCAVTSVVSDSFRPCGPYALGILAGLWRNWILELFQSLIQTQVWNTLKITQLSGSGYKLMRLMFWVISQSFLCWQSLQVPHVVLLHLDLHTDFSGGRSGGSVFPSLKEFSTVCCDLQSQRLSGPIINRPQLISSLNNLWVMWQISWEPEAVFPFLSPHLCTLQGGARKRCWRAGRWCLMTDELGWHQTGHGDSVCPQKWQHCLDILGTKSLYMCLFMSLVP